MEKEKLERRGVIFTFEALLSLLLIFALTGLLPLLARQDSNTLEKTIFLLDAFEALENGYHSELSFWAESGPGVPDNRKLLAAISDISSVKKLRFYLNTTTKKLPRDLDCDEDINIDRLIVTSDRWKKVSFVLCKD